MNPLNTPFGLVKITIDDKEIEYEVREGRKLEYICPDVMGRYHIEINFKPDGKKHVIKCTIDEGRIAYSDWETSENLECKAFYNNNREKLSIGLYGEAWGYINGVLVDCDNDYDIDYLDNGMSYIILESTKTEDYVFGICWIDDVGYDEESIEDDVERETQTWFGADPSREL